MIDSESHRQPSIEPPLVGRGVERARLAEERAFAKHGSGRLVVIGGEAGIGKTTLVRDLAREASAEGFVTLTGHCDDLTAPPPFGPWTDLVARVRPDDALPPVPRVFRDGGFAGVSSQTALFADMVDFLAQIARNRPLLLVLEDMHWSDAESIGLAKFLASVIAELPILFALTYRLDELTRRHQLYRQLPNLLNSGPSVRIELKRLDRAELIALVASRAAPAAATPALIDYLVQHSEGNPYFAVELLRALDETGALATPGDPAALATVVLPLVLEQVIETRVARLGETMRAPLAQAALIGHEFDLDLWTEVSGLPDEELLTIVERGVEAHLLEARGDGARVRFQHALIREALLLSVVAPRRRAWHRRIAEALALRPNVDPDVVAHHYDLAGDVRAVEWLIQAGERAQRAYAWVSAADRFIAAARLLEASQQDERQRAWLLYRAARLARIADPERGVELLEIAAEIGRRLGDEVLAADARYSRGYLLAYANRFGEGVRETIAGIDELERLPPERSAGDWQMALWLADSLPEHEAAAERDVDSIRLLHQTQGVHHRRGGQAFFMALGGLLTDARAVATRFLAAIATIEHPGGLIVSSAGHTNVALGVAHAGLGAPDESRRAFERARLYYRELDHHALAAFSYLEELHDVALTYDADRPTRRRRLAADAEDAFRRAGGALPADVPPKLALLGALVADGEWQAAREILAEARCPENIVFKRGVVAAELTMAAHEGRRDDAWRLIRAAMPDGIPEPGALHFQFALTLTRHAAALALDAGELDEASRWLDGLDRWLGWNRAVLGRAEAALLRARLHHAAGDLADARACANEALALASKPRQPLALAAAHRLLGRLAQTAGDPTAAVAHANDALALAAACEAPLETLPALVDLAELRFAAGERLAGAALVDRARAVCRGIERLAIESRLDELAPGRASAPPAPFGLTARELDVLRLIASGLSDAAAAERLFISPRTVGQHLRSVYAKLGVNSRAAATRFAMEHDLA